MTQHPQWPAWRYGPKGEAAVFESEADVPKGWHDHPSKHEKAPGSTETKTTAESKPAPKPAAKPAPKKPGRKPKPKAAAPLDL